MMWLRILLFCFLIPLIGSCLPLQTEKAKVGACDDGYSFNAKTRTCTYIGKPKTPPTNSLKTLQLLENTELNAMLTYEDANDDFATSCEVGNFSVALTASSDCSCVGGYCTITLTPVLNYYGMAEFYYTVTDVDGVSTATMVSVSIAHVDQYPLGSIPNPEPVSFLEDASSIPILLGYIDVDGDLATECEVELGSDDYAFANACTCDSAGVCSFSLTGKPYKYTLANQSYTYRVKANGLWSDSVSGHYAITHVNHLPSLVSISQATAVDEPIFPDAGPWSVDFTIIYKEMDGETPTSCGVVAGSLTGVTFTDGNCVCGAPDATTYLGSCTITLDMAVGFEDKNNNTTVFSFKSNIQDSGDASYVESSEIKVISVPAQNDPAQVSSDQILDGETIDATEGETTSISGSTYKLKIDEGGIVDEDVQSLFIQVLSSNTEIIPEENIDVFWGESKRTVDSTGWYDLGDGSDDASSEYISFDITPRQDQVLVDTQVTLSVYYVDSSWILPSLAPIEFIINVMPGKHKPVVRMRRQIKPLFYDKYANASFCDDANSVSVYEDCIRNHSPLIPDPKAADGTIPTKMGAIFYDYNSGLRYASTGTGASNLWQSFVTNCPFSTAREERACKRYQSLTNQYLNCVGESSPVGDSDLTPTVLSSYFYDYIHDVCYVSVANGSSGYKWQEHNLAPETNICASETFTTQNDGAPSDSTITSESMKGDFYYDATHTKCYVATWDEAASPPEGSWASFYTRCPITKSGCYQMNCSEGTGDPLSSAINSGVDEGKLYHNNATGECFVAKWNQSIQSGVWLEYEGECIVGEGICRKQNCIGEDAPRRNSDPSLDFTSTAIGNFYYDYNNEVCYKSIGTARGEWVVYGPGSDIANNILDLPDLYGNENNELIFKDLYLNAGIIDGRLRVVFELLTNKDATDPLYGYGDIRLFDRDHVRAFCNGVELDAELSADDVTNKRVTFYLDDDNLGTNLCPSSEPYKSKVIEFRFTPRNGLDGYGRSEIKMRVSNSNLVDENVNYFSLVVYPIGAVHQGWSGLKSVGGMVNRWGQYKDNLKVTLKWDDFVYSPGIDEKTPAINMLQTDYTTVSITGYNVYRRMAGEEFRFDMPLNKTPININTRIFEDTTGNTNDAMGPAKPGLVYYYSVKGIDSLNGNLIAAPDHYTNVMRVVAPPDNTVFVHRWMINKEMCEKMGQSDTIDETHNFRCTYKGPGEYLIDGYAKGDKTYFDIGNDLLVDRFEAGCPYGRDGDADYVALSTVANTPNSDGDIYYSRDSGRCKINLGGGAGSWFEMNDVNITVNLTSPEAEATQVAELPPLVYMSQDKSNDICKKRRPYDITVSMTTGDLSTNDFTLPSRKHQIAYSSWDSGAGYKDADIEVLEQGLALNSYHRCNSTAADGLEEYYSNQDIPNSADFYSLPGSRSSNIRSVITGSKKTEMCVSRYGIQDIVGNVKEWVSDRLHCLTAERCEGVYADHPLKDVTAVGGGGLPAVGNVPNYSGIYCPYTTKDQLSDVTGNTCGDGTDSDGVAHGHCISSQSPQGRVVPGGANIIFYDSFHDKCYVSTAADANSWQEMSAYTSCPITPADVETSCNTNPTGIHCVDTAILANAVRVGSYFLNLTDRACYKSQADLSWSGVYSDVTKYDLPLPVANQPVVLNSNYDMRSTDTFYHAWGLDGRRGPCNDNLGVCEESIDGWAFDETNYDARYFIFPLGLPVSSNFYSLFNETDVAASLLEIGGSQGISSKGLHDDYFAINSDNIVASDASGMGGFTTGGSYKSGTSAGRYTIEAYPVDDNAGATSEERNIGPDIGFRCMTTIPWSGFYDE